MQADNHQDVEVIAAWQGCSDVNLKNKAIERAQELMVETNQWLRQEAMEMANKRIARNPRYANVTVAIDRATLHEDDNMTIVVLDSGGEQVVGWAKFNPKDVRFLDGINKKGKYWFREESKYRHTAGVMKALDRAIDQLLP